MDLHPRDEAKEAVLGEIIAHGSDAVFSFLNDTGGQEEQGEEADSVTEQGEEADSVTEQWRRKDMIMMAPVTKCRWKKETVMTARVTERRRELLQSPARYIY